MAATPTLLPVDAKPPKSKSQPYYSIHSSWQDVVPIPQPDQTGTLAAIRYWPRYTEAMSYLRAVMADNEVSERALALTTDLIGMNPAHYTVWIYRMNVLRGLWADAKVSEVGPEAQEGVNSGRDKTMESDFDRLLTNVKNELKWLDEVSFRNLKNYQIWHHRHALIDLLPEDPAGKRFDNVPPQTSTTTAAPTSAETWGIHNVLVKPSKPAPALDDNMTKEISTLISSEQTFLAQILSLDTKNYHIWSYRQWLCTRYPTWLLPFYTNNSTTNTIFDPSQPTPSQSHAELPPRQSTASHYRQHSEVKAMDTLIADDLRNNSAWSHRYFILFGHHELRYSQTRNVVLKTVNEERLLEAEGLVDANLVDAEIEFTETETRRAPMNGSSWNYLRGVLGHGGRNISSMKAFCEEFLGPGGDLWIDQYADVQLEGGEIKRREVGVKSSRAIEWLSEIYAGERTEEGIRRARECLKSLAEKWDIIRKGYWEYLEEKMGKE